MNHPFKDIVASEDELRALVGEPSERAVKKEIDTLDTYARAFIANAPFLLLATSGADGRCDVSPKGDAPGFVHVLDEHHLVIPDRPGNRRVDGMRNLVTNAHVGLIFMIPGRQDTLRVNGRAWIVRDHDLISAMAVNGKLPQLAIGVQVEECFFHCPKAFVRSSLWQHEKWPSPDVVASFAQMIFDRTKLGGSVEAVQKDLDERLKTSLY